MLAHEKGKRFLSSDQEPDCNAKHLEGGLPAALGGGSQGSEIYRLSFVPRLCILVPNWTEILVSHHYVVGEYIHILV